MAAKTDAGVITFLASPRHLAICAWDAWEKIDWARRKSNFRSNALREKSASLLKVGLLRATRSRPSSCFTPSSTSHAFGSIPKYRPGSRYGMRTLPAQGAASNVRKVVVLPQAELGEKVELHRADDVVLRRRADKRPVMTIPWFLAA